VGVHSDMVRIMAFLAVAAVLLPQVDSWWYYAPKTEAADVYSGCGAW
jgi:hypothetical protein